jgi:hypothetical protein
MSAGRNPMTSGTREDAEVLAASEFRCACDAFLRSRNLPTSFAPQRGAEGPPGAGEGQQSTPSNTMKPDQFAERTGHRAVGPRKWTRKTSSTPPPSMKPDWRAIVSKAIAAGLATKPSKPTPKS